MKITKVKEGILLSGEFPSELADAKEARVVRLRDGNFLLSPSGALSSRERELLKKLSAIRFEKRIPAEVNDMLSAQEKEALGALMEKGIVQILRGEKYRETGVYSISNSAFVHSDGSVAQQPVSTQISRQPASAQPTRQSQPMAQQKPVFKSPELLQLDKNGWLALDNEQSARNFGYEAALRVKAGELHGLKSFDGKYYFITKKFAEEAGEKLRAALEKSDKTADEIANAIGIAPEGCRALLCHLGENGDILEKKKGKYALA